jgi:hypothetical protein
MSVVSFLFCPPTFGILLLLASRLDLAPFRRIVSYLTLPCNHLSAFRRITVNGVFEQRPETRSSGPLGEPLFPAASASRSDFSSLPLISPTHSLDLSIRKCATLAFL